MSDAPFTSDKRVPECPYCMAGDGPCVGHGGMKKVAPLASNSESLLPCPFCGHSAALHEDDDGRWQQVICGGCGAKGPERMKGYIDKAVNRWNGRAHETKPVREPPHCPTCECGAGKYCAHGFYNGNCPHPRCEHTRDALKASGERCNQLVVTQRCQLPKGHEGGHEWIAQNGSGDATWQA